MFKAEVTAPFLYVFLTSLYDSGKDVRPVLSRFNGLNFRTHNRKNKMLYTHRAGVDRCE
jgi:hypothetical protein